MSNSNANSDSDHTQPLNSPKLNLHHPVPPKGEGLIASMGESMSSPSEDLTLEEKDDLAQLEMNFSKLKPTQYRPGERTISTSIRLRRQGFTTSGTVSLTNFAMKSIRRGSDEWNILLRPFVSDLIFRSLEYRRFQSDVSFRPYTCHAVVLFVDLSNYSKITAEIAHKGAHTISTVVNDYLSRLLQIVTLYGGDVVKFAGDAVLIVWEGSNEDIENNLIIASKCVLDMQEKAGTYVVDAKKSLYFRIHCGLCVGMLESEIFVAPNFMNMQKYFHSVSGESLIEISDLVDIAKAGEICISAACVEILGKRGTYKDIDDRDDCKLLTKINIDNTTNQTIGLHLEQVLSDRLVRRNKRIEEDFIHPSVLRLLVLGGLSPTQIAQMRNLCVLFIAMTSQGSSVNWLIEVQTILDKNRCPIIQIIDDDKGVHVVAAVNLYESIPESSLMGLAICHELVSQEVGCAIGMAQGPTFCGVTGCSTIACRWDVTGPPAVRAARLMQYALYEGIDVAIDRSVYNDSPMATAKLTIQNPSVQLKGTAGTVPIYTLSHTTISAAFRVLETLFPPVHEQHVTQIMEHITNDKSKRCAVVVTGATLTGKKSLCQRAAGYADLVPYLHVSDESMGFLQLARTIATWFQYIDSEEIKACTENIFCHLEKKRWSRAHDDCVNLINLAITMELQACFLIDRIQLLDDFSLSLIRECLHGKSRRQRSLNLSTSNMSSNHSFRESNSEPIEDGCGKICFLCVHVSLYTCKSAEHIVNDVTRSHKSLNIPIIKVGEGTVDELRAMSDVISGVVPSERMLNASALACGLCIGYHAERMGAVRNLSSKMWSEGRMGFVELNDNFEWTVPLGSRRDVISLPVTQICGEVAMKFSHVFDGLPPVFQTFCKVLCVSARTKFFKLPRAMMWNVLNDLIAEGVENGVYNIVVDEMVEMNLLKVEFQNDEEVLSFQCPALGDIALDVCTPIQLKSIGGALIERLEPHVYDTFVISFVLANLHDLVGDEYKLREKLWMHGYKCFLEECQDWDPILVLDWKEIIADEMRALGLTRIEIVMGKDPNLRCSFVKNSMSETMMLLKQYHSPIAFGPLGLTLSIITSTVYFLCGEFHGYSAERIVKLRDDLSSGCMRYLYEVDALESFLSLHGFPADVEMLEIERSMINEIKLPANSMGDLDHKASILYDTFIPTHVVDRLNRIRMLVEKLRETKPPYDIQIQNETLRLAYQALTSSSKKFHCDRAQDALMIMATRNWKPRPTAVTLPLYYLQTLARIRNKVMKQLSGAELIIWKHQQSYVDLEAFLVITSLVYQADDKLQTASSTS